MPAIAIELIFLTLKWSWLEEIHSPFGLVRRGKNLKVSRTSPTMKGLVLLLLAAVCNAFSLSMSTKGGKGGVSVAENM